MIKHYCFGDGKCIKKSDRSSYFSGYFGGYYKPFKCPYNCKLVKCLFCKDTQMPKWALIDNGGKCKECLKKQYREKIMNKLFKQ